MTELVRKDSPLDDDSLRQRLRAVEGALDARSQDVSRLTTELADFRLRYRREVGQLHDELEELERAIAELELGEFAKRLAQEDADRPAAAPPPRAQPARALTSDAVRRLFRDVAKTVHPDLAGDTAARDRRHALMVEANRAYATGDADRLRSILDAWEKSPEAVHGTGPDAERDRLLRRIGQIEEQIAMLAVELAELQETPLWRLKVMVDEAAARGKDLVAEQVRRLKRDITAARNRLDAMRL